MIDQISLLYLNALYEQLLRSITDSRKRIVLNSALLTLLNLSSNVVFNIISQAYLQFSDASLPDLEYLLRESLIKRSDDIKKTDEYVITIKGIYQIESRRIGLDLFKILQFIQAEKFEFPVVNKPFKDDEKAIVLSLIGVRAFSDNCTMNLNNEGSCDKWKEIYDSVICPFLKQIKKIKCVDFFSRKSGNEHPVSYLMRHANDLPKKTNNLFYSSRDNQYFLNIDYHDAKKSIYQISFLLGKVFQIVETIDNANEIKEFLISCAHDQGLFVIKELDFVNFNWDQIIIESVDKMYLDLEYVVS